jgi:hypothetical protein
MSDLSVEKGGHGNGNVLLALLVVATIAAIALLGFFMWERANSGGNAAPFLAAVEGR